MNNWIRSFWELDSLGAEPMMMTLLMIIIIPPIHIIKLKNGQYKVPLPWKEYHQPLPDNYELRISLKRLKGLLQKLRDPDILKECSTIIQEQLDKGIIEIAEQTTGRAHYLPHHTVIRHNKEATKVRIVYTMPLLEQKVHH